MLVEILAGHIILPGVVVAPTQNVQADVVLLGGRGQLGQHDRGHLDALLILPFHEEAGQHHAAHRLHVLAVREDLQEEAPVFLGHQHFPDNGGSPHQVIEILLAFLRLVVIELQLLVGRKGSTHVLVLLVNVGRGRGGDHLMRIPGTPLSGQFLQVSLQHLLVNLAVALRRVLELAIDNPDLGQAGLDVVNGGPGTGHQGIKFKRGTFHLGRQGIRRQFHEDRSKAVHLEGFQPDVSPVLPEEIQQGLLVLLLNNRFHHGLKSHHDALVGSGEGLLVVDRDLEILDPSRNLEELEVRHRHVHVKGPLLIRVTLGVTLLQEFLVHPDRNFPLLRADGGVPPLEKGLRVVMVEAPLGGPVQARPPGILIGVLGVAHLEGLHGRLPLLELQLAVSLVVPEPAELRAKEGLGPPVVLRHRLGQNCMGLGPFLGPHGGK